MSESDEGGDTVAEEDLLLRGAIDNCLLMVNIFLWDLEEDSRGIYT
jgi:hypothetical protein